MSGAHEQAAPRESDAILARLLDLHPKAIDLSLGRMTRLLDALGNPERAMPPVIHVAGTNGKGSVVAFLDAMLRAAGYRVSSYVSPHLVRFAERIRLNGVPIAEDALRQSLAHCEAVNDGAPITFFEITTAAAFHAFERHPSDVLVLEVGLGGRLDATNVVARPTLAVITPVSIDHTHYLGETLPLIAAEKAGILKQGVTGVIGRQEAAAGVTIERVAGDVGAPLARLGHEWSFESQSSHLVVRDAHGEGRYPLPGLKGAHQVQNAALAAVCARAAPRLRRRRRHHCPGALRGALARAAPAHSLGRTRRGLGALGRWRPQRSRSHRSLARRRGLDRPASRPRGRHAEHAAAQGLISGRSRRSCAGWRRSRFPIRPRAEGRTRFSPLPALSASMPPRTPASARPSPAFRQAVPAPAASWFAARFTWSATVLATAGVPAA